MEKIKDLDGISRYKNLKTPSRRHTYNIMYDLLRCILTDERVTWTNVMYRCNLNGQSMPISRKYLIEKGLVIELGNTKKLTDKGILLYAQLHNFLVETHIDDFKPY